MPRRRSLDPRRGPHGLAKFRCKLDSSGGRPRHPSRRVSAKRRIFNLDFEISSVYAAYRPATFGFYNFVGAVSWVGVCVGAGLLFGNVPVVKNNFSLVRIGIIGISLLPVVFEYLGHRGRI